MNKTLNTNAIAFIALCNEYCQAIETARETERDEFVTTVLRLLPRLYISATDLATEVPADEDPYLESFIDEDYYESVRRSIEGIFGADDVYLEVFEEDMKYSDTPISASIAEGLADIFQDLYNFIEMVKDAPDPIIAVALVAVKENFESYWGHILCNVLRAVNHLKYSQSSEY